jgi:oligosaccharyltransferase complex subunit delta (ribophorin II)
MRHSAVLPALCLLALAGLQLAAAQLAAVVTPQQLRALAAAAQEKVERGTCPAGVRHASEVVLATGGACKAACTALEQLQRKAASVDEIYHASAAVANCGCKSSLSAEQTAAIRAALNTDTLPTLAHGVLAAQFANQVTVQAETLSSRLYALLDADGLFKSAASDEAGSIENTVVAVDAFAQLASSLKDTSTAATLAAVVDKVSNLLPGGKGKYAHAALLAPLSKLSSDGAVPKVGSSRVLTLGDSLVQLAHSKNLEQVHRALAGLQALEAYKTSPIYANLKAHAFEAKKEAELRVSFLNALGQPADVEEAEVTFVTASDGKFSAVQTPVRMVADAAAPSTFAAKLPGLDAGVYKVQIGVQVRNRQKRVPVDVAIAIQEPAKVASVEVGVSESKSLLDADMSAVKQQDGLAGLHASGEAFEVLHVRFAVQAQRRPQQAFIRMQHVDSGMDSFFVADVVNSNDENKHIFTAAISLADESEKLQYKDGRYRLALFVADAAFAKPLEWAIGSVEVQLPPKPRKEYPLYSRALLHDSDTTLTALPEIHHQFRPEAKRPPAIVPALFTLLLFVPFAGFVLRVLQIKPDFKQIDVYGLAYIGCIAAVLLLYAMYWLAIPLMVALRYLAPLAVVTIIAGQLALRSATSRRAEAVAAATKETKLD